MKLLFQLYPILVVIISLTCAVSGMNPEPPVPGISTRVVNGVEAKDGQFPYIVAMLVYQGFLFREASHGCDGSIIASNWILTAAHCILHSDSFLNIASYDIFAGSVIYREYTQFDRIYEEDAFAHPGYNDSTLDNDIALLKSHGFDINTKTVQSVALAPREWIDADSSFAGKTLIVSGFGFASDNRQRPNRLLWAKVPYISRAECQGYYYEDELNETIFYGGDLDIPVHALCQGDSGGPLVLKKSSGKVVQIGVVSFSGIPCSVAPGGYTNVAMFRDWIDSIMAEHPN